MAFSGTKDLRPTERGHPVAPAAFLTTGQQSSPLGPPKPKGLGWALLPWRYQAIRTASSGVKKG